MIFTWLSAEQGTLHPWMCECQGAVTASLKNRMRISQLKPISTPDWLLLSRLVSGKCEECVVYINLNTTQILAGCRLDTAGHMKPLGVTYRLARYMLCFHSSLLFLSPLWLHFCSHLLWKNTFYFFLLVLHFLVYPMMLSRQPANAEVLHYLEQLLLQPGDWNAAKGSSIPVSDSQVVGKLQDTSPLTAQAD